MKETVKEMVKDRRDEHQDDLKGCREEHKRRHRESDNLAHEKSRHQESPVRKDRNREAPGYNWLGEGGDLGHEKRVSSLKRVQDDLPFADKKHSNTYLSRQHEEDRKMKQRSKMTQGKKMFFVFFNSGVCLTKIISCFVFLQQMRISQASAQGTS